MREASAVSRSSDWQFPFSVLVATEGVGEPGRSLRLLNLISRSVQRPHL